MAGLGKKTFVAGEVLLAQDVNGYLMDQSVMVFGGTAARSSAIPTPTEGMMSYRTDDDVVEVFNGTSYVSVGGGAAGDGALTLLKTQTIGTTVASVTVTNAFSTNHGAYKIIILDGTASVGLDLRLKLGATTTGYYAGYLRTVYSNSAFQGQSDNNASQFTRAGSASTNNINFNVNILNPFIARYTFFSNQLLRADSVSSAGVGGGFLNDTTSYTEFTISTSAGTLTGGTIYVYGYEK
jgi:hypothetical protein